MIILDTLYTMQDLEGIATTLNALIPQGSIVTLVGSLGAGKTTLIRSFLKLRGVTDVVTSPTFSYVNQYNGPYNEHFFHFDVYRLGDAQQFVSAGFDEYLECTGSTVFIEWPEIIFPLLRNRDYIAITLEYVDDEHRRIIVNKHKGEQKHA